MKKRLVTLLLLLVCCLAWANCAWAAEQSGQRSLPQLSKILPNNRNIPRLRWRAA